ALTLILVAVLISLYAKTPAATLNAPAATPTAEPIVTQPASPSLPNGPLKQSVIAAGDYLVRQQLSNGELSYQVDFQSGARQYSPSNIRLMSGTGALYTV